MKKHQQQYDGEEITVKLGTHEQRTILNNKDAHH